jgi:hypothetical protein
VCISLPLPPCIRMCAREGACVSTCLACLLT